MGLVPMYKKPSLLPNVRIQGEGIGYEPGRGSLQQSLTMLVL